jgi:arginase
MSQSIPRAARVSTRQFDEYSALYRMFDVQGNGRLTRQQTDEALQVLGLGLSEQDRQKLLDAVDTAGEISQSDFIDWLYQRSDFDLDHELRQLFSLLDTSGDGLVSCDEMLALARCLDPDLNETALDVLIRSHDTDDDGRVSFDDFMAMQRSTTHLQLTIAGIRRFRKLLGRYALAARIPRIALVEVDSDLGAGRAGASGGIEMLRESALQRALATRKTALRGRQQGRDSTTPHARNIEAIRTLLEQASALVCETLQQHEFPVVLAGDHSTAAGTIAGIAQAFPDKRLGVVWIDAHADIHSPYTSLSGNMHGMPIAIAGRFDNDANAVNAPDAVTLAHWEACKALGRDGKANLDLHDLVYVSVRDTEPAEDAAIAQFGIPVFRTADIRRLGPEAVAQACLDHLGDADILYVSFDVDSMDAAICMGTGTPVPDGITADEAARINRRLVSDPRVVCWEICEINPELDLRNSTGQVSLMVYQQTLDALQTRLATAAAIHAQVRRLPGE